VHHGENLDPIGEHHVVDDISKPSEAEGTNVAPNNAEKLWRRFNSLNDVTKLGYKFTALAGLCFIQMGSDVPYVVFCFRPKDCR
jgi:hypothetical protein